MWESTKSGNQAEIQHWKRIVMHLSALNLLNDVILRVWLKSLALALVVNILLVDFAAGETGEFNRRATATAQILAGIVPPAGDRTLDRLVTLEAFAEHQ